MIDTDGFAFKLVYRRKGWTHNQSRTYSRLSDLDAFSENKLYAGDRPDLAEIVELQVFAREVGPWREFRR